MKATHTGWHRQTARRTRRCIQGGGRGRGTRSKAKSCYPLSVKPCGRQTAAHMKCMCMHVRVRVRVCACVCVCVSGNLIMMGLVLACHISDVNRSMHQHTRSHNCGGTCVRSCPSSASDIQLMHAQLHTESQTERGSEI